MPRRPMSRRRTLAIGSLALVLLGAPFLPDGDTPPALETSSTPGTSLTDATAGEGAVTPAMRAEIDAVLAEGRTAARTTAGTRLRPAALVRSQVRCADFEGQRYCLNAGWTDSTEDEVVTELARSATSESARSAYREETGDLSLTAQLRQRAALSPAARERPTAPSSPGRPVGGQGVAAAPPGPGRRPAGRVPRPAPRDPHPDRVGAPPPRRLATRPDAARKTLATTRSAAGSSATTRSPSRPAPTGAVRPRCR